MSDQPQQSGSQPGWSGQPGNPQPGQYGSQPGYPPPGYSGAPPAQGPGYPPPGFAQPAYPAPGYGPPVYAPPTAGSATTALVLSILSWVLVPIILAIVALVFASKARAEIEASGGRLGGAGMVSAAKIISWINIILWGIGTVFLVIFLVVVARGSSSVIMDDTGFTVGLATLFGR